MIVPERHGMDNTVRLGCRRDVLFPCARQVECISNDAVAGATREDRFLHCYIELGIAVHPAAHFGILAFAVLPDDHEVDFSRPTPCEWTRYTFQKPRWAQIHIFFKSAADGNQQSP